MGRLASTKSGGLHEAPFRSRRCGIRPVVAGAVQAQTPAPPAAQAPVREITKIAGEVYRFRNNGHFSVFAVTSAGIIATDPVNAAAASLAQGRDEEALAGQGDQVRGLQPRSCRPYLRRRGVGRYRDGGGARQCQGGHHRRKAADRGAASHLQRPRDDRSRRHRPGADLCRPQPFQQFAGDALPQGEDHLRRRLHSGERRGVPRLPRRLSRRVDRTRCARSRRWSSTSWRRATARSATRPT